MGLRGEDEEKGTRRGLSILCFEHCGKRIFSLKNIPDACPVCNLLITQCDLKIPPFAVPSPFKKAVDFPCSIVIKPTKGNFLDDYSNKSNLHIAVTDSSGEVYEFDRQGLHRDRTYDWENCLVLDLSGADPLVLEMIQDPDWGEYWDICLNQTAGSDAFTRENYHEDDNNCFNFVLSFLLSLNQSPFSGWAGSKVDF
ncbi:MKRN2 opposite strand protein isoform X2 [Eurytemora carolleeae]|nr:MKRN2 opposite strand protein isoform X2 [Eurytemora carolleeae]|eukprot:XP_023320239.1 MKRN2 opposite strand protein-like isoform X2 [Eurytemora affinis]